MSVRVYRRLLGVWVRETNDGVMSSLGAAVIGFVQYAGLLVLYHVAYQSSSLAQLLPYASVVWSLAIFQIIWGMGFRWLWKDIAVLVQNGTVEVMLNRPISFLAQIIVRRCARGVSFWFWPTAITTLITAWFFAGPPVTEWSWMWFLGFVTFFVLGNIIGILLSALVGLASFFLQDVQPLFWLIDKLQMVITGSVVPLAFLPVWMRTVAEWSPFGLVAIAGQWFYPAHMVALDRLMVSMIVWLIILSVFAWGLWSLARRRLTINGG